MLLYICAVVFSSDIVQVDPLHSSSFKSKHECCASYTCSKDPKRRVVVDGHREKQIVAALVDVVVAADASADVGGDENGSDVDSTRRK